MKMTKLGIPIAVAALAVACGQANETADDPIDPTQTFSEAAGELANDVAAADVSAGADGAAQAGQDATDAAKKEAAAAIEEGIQTQ